MDETAVAVLAVEALLQSGPWGLALAAILYTGSRAMTTAAEHLCDLFPKLLNIVEKLVDKGLELRLKTYHYTLDDSEDEP